MMSVCRICLSSNPTIDITEIKSTQNDSGESIIFFCLGIQIIPELEESTMFCITCYTKIEEFHQFKSLSLRNEAVLRSLGIKEFLKDDIKKEVCSQSSDNECEEEPFIENMILECKFEQDEVAHEDLGPEDQDDYHNEPPIECIELKPSGEQVSAVSVKKKLKRGNSKDNIKTTSQEANNDAKRKRHTCEICGALVCDLTCHLLRHKTEIEPAVQCEYCYKFFTRKQSLEKHIMYMHLKFPRPKSNEKVCDLCHRQFSNQRGVEYHKVKVHMENIKTKCPICNKEVSKYYLKMHMEISHEADNHQFECDTCGRTFPKKHFLRRHITSHTGVKPFACEICGAVFRLKYSVDLHRREVHEKQKDHVCHVCSKGFFSNSKLQQHIRIHEAADSEGKFICPECGKPLANEATLKNHRELHTGNRHVCQLCNKTFATRKNAIRHLSTHTQERKFSCRYCTAGFVRTSGRRKHELEVHMHQKTKKKKYPRTYKYRPKGKKAKEERERQKELAEQSSAQTVKIELDDNIHKYIKKL